MLQIQKLTVFINFFGSKVATDRFMLTYSIIISDTLYVIMVDSTYRLLNLEFQLVTYI